MKRRRLVLLVSAAVLGLLGIAFAGAIFFVTRTDVGHAQVRRVAMPFIARLFPGGKIYLGRIGGNLINEITIDSIEIREAHTNEVFLRTGRISLSYSPRDLADYRFFIRRLRVEHPYVHFIRHENEVWNFKEIFASKNTGPPTPKDPSRRAYVVIDSTSFRDGTFLLTMPWHPDTALRGAKRDSSIRAHVDNPAKAVTRRADGFGRTYAWRNGSGLLAHVRLADPDSDRTAGQEFRIATLSVDEYEPTFKFRNLTGTVRRLSDSVWFSIGAFEMPASRGSGTGKVWWGSDLPVRYDIAIRGDSVSLDDVNWVYPTLPRTGGGKLDLLIKNDPKDLHVVDFHLKNMDVRSTGSHLVGDMSFGTGAPLLLVRNVNLRADPVDFDLIRALNGKPFPVDWQGQLVGSVKARGGPLTNFVVDDARGTFRDAHVRGAQSRFSGRGELDILYPSLTAFHDFDVDVGSLDLRTVEYLYPSFPRLGGFLSGTATLDSSYLDVRFSDANMTHQDGLGEPSRITGSGRVTYGDPFMLYDVTLEAQPLSLTMLSRSPTFASLPELGLFSGPIRAKGSSPDLEVSTSLQGESGALTFDGRVDIDSVGGFGGRGRGQFSSINLAALLNKPMLPAGTLSGHYEADLAGETAAALQGAVALDFERTVLDDVRVHPSVARLRFAGGQMKIDSLVVHTDAFTATASGGLGLPKGTPDSVRFSVAVDSLGGLRPLIATRDTILGTVAAVGVDSLAGSLKATGSAVGTMDSFSLTGRLEGTDLYFNELRGRALVATVDMRNLPSAGSAGGIIAATVDSVTLGGIALDTIGGEARLGDLGHARVVLGTLLHNGPTLMTTGNWTRVGGVGHDILMDSLALTIGASRWRLDAPSHIALDSTGVRVVSLLLRNADSASIAVAVNVPTDGSALANLRATHVPLHDLGILTQATDSIAGLADASLSVTGTKSDPAIAANATLSSVRWRSVDLDRVSADAKYQDQRVNGTLDVVRGGRQAMTATASVPANVTLFSVKSRDDSVSASIMADSTDLAILKAFVRGSEAASVTGLLTAKVDAGGTWTQPVFGGNVAIRGGSVKLPQAGDVTFSNINASATGVRNVAGEDSINLNLQATTDDKPAGRVQIDGFVKNVLQTKVPPTFALALGADNFHALNKRSLAELYVSTTDTVRLRGTTQSSVLTGDLLVNRGSIFLADREIARKQAVEIQPDTAVAKATRSMFSTLLSNLVVRDVSVTLGEDVRLRSAEANVKLAGSLSVVPSTDRSRRTSATTGLPIPTLDLEGTLSTVSGTYNLNLGLVQREFQVQPNGTVVFDGPPQNPELDIRAQYNVRRQGDRDLGVIVNLHGRLLPYPVIDFSSTADYTIAQSDLVSYLLIGRAGFDYGASPRAAEVLSSFLAPSLSALASDKLRQSLGGWLDVFQFQLGTSNSVSPTAGSAGTGPWQNYLYGSTIGAEKQFKNIFLNVNTGFCQFSNTNQGFNPATSFGAKAEYRINPLLSTKLAYDPPTTSRICGQQSIIGLIPTPPNFSLSLTHTWRF